MANLKTDKRNDWLYILFTILCITGVYFIIWSFTGQWPWKSQFYNSYVLEAVSWTQGRLDVDTNYAQAFGGWLELAVYEGKCYVSFPLFPAYVMFPFALLFGEATPDGMIAFFVSLLGAVYTYKLVREFNKSELSSMFWTLFMILGTNLLFTSVNAWVWFIAQSMNYTLLVMSLYFAKTKRGSISLALWACAVGCRPFSVLYIGLILYLLYINLKDKNTSLFSLILKHWKWYIAPVLIAVSYMALNFARFDNPLEFGHNYLPEFTESQNGQFHISYVAENFKNLFRFPALKEDSTFDYPLFNGMNIFFISPIFVSYAVYTIICLIKKETVDKITMLTVFLTLAIELFCITSHKTMGGSQFGNRYVNDVLPLVLFGTMLSAPKSEKGEFLMTPLFMIGFTLNVIGTVLYYTNKF